MDTFERGTISPHAVISEDAHIGTGVTVGAFSVIHAGVELGDFSVVGSHCVLGEPSGDFYVGDSSNDPGGTARCAVGQNSIIRSHSVIYAGTTVGSGFETGHRVTVREDTVVGDDVRVGTLSDIQAEVSIGDHVRVHSNVFIGGLSVIEDFAWLFPSVVLTNDPHPPSDTCTRGATVRPYAVVAAGSLLMPRIEIGSHALVGAMSLVTRDVDPETVVIGSPAKPVGSVRDVTCRHGALDSIYPWPQQFRRGYPDGALPPPEHFDR